MICASCGNPMHAGSRACTSCGAEVSAGVASSSAPAGGAAPVSRAAATHGGGGGAQPHVPNYLWQSIAVTVCCCLIGGILAILQAAKVDPALRAGDYQAAVEASNAAKKWCLLSVVIGLVANIAFIALQIFVLSQQ